MANFCDALTSAYSEVPQNIARLGIRPTVRAMAAFFGKPMNYLRKFGDKAERVLGYVGHMNNLHAHQISRASELMKELKQVRLAGITSSREATTAAWHVLDTVPSRVLASLGANGASWDVDTIISRSLKHLSFYDESEAGTLLKRFYDPRYLDPARLDRAELSAALDKLSPLQRRSVVKLAQFYRDTRAAQIVSKRASLAMIYKMRGDDPSKLAGASEEVLDAIGPTVSSYIPHFLYDAVTADVSQQNLFSHITKQSMEEIGDVVGAAMSRINAMTNRKEDRVTLLSRELGTFFAGEGAPQALVDQNTRQLRRTASWIIREYADVDSQASLSSTLRRIPREVFVPYLHRRVKKDMAAGVMEFANPFDQFMDYAGVTLRQTYMEPLANYMRLNSDLFASDPVARRYWDNLTNTIQGVPGFTGVDYVLGAVPGAREVRSFVEGAVIKTLYWKYMWANAGPALLNSTQVLQMGLGKHGAWHSAGAARMLMAEDGFFKNVLQRMAIADNTFSHAAEGGIGNASAASIWRETVEKAKLAGNGYDAARITLKGGAQSMGVALDFMQKTDSALRYYTAAAKLHESAVDQLLRRNPGSRIVRRAHEMFVEAADGRLLDPVVELRNAYAGQVAPGVRTFRTTKLADQAAPAWHLDWQEAVDHSVFGTHDVNFTFSSWNYSPMERAIRNTIPIVGPAGAMFTNYSMNTLARVSTDLSTILRYSARAAGAPGLPVTNGEVRQASMRLGRYFVGSMLIGGPGAIGLFLAPVFKFGHMIDPDLPENMDDPRVKGIIDGLESYSIGGMLGADYASRAGLNADFLNFLAGGRFADNPLADTITTAWNAGMASDPEKRATARYDLLGSSLASAIDPTNEWGHNPIGRANPFVPMMLYNLVQAGVDAYDHAHGAPSVDALGRAMDLPTLPNEELVRRTFVGRTIYQREKMADIAKRRPQLAADLADTRRRFINSYLKHDVAGMKEANAQYHKLTPIEGVGSDRLHPDLQLGNDAIKEALIARLTTKEWRQLKSTARGVARVDLNRNLEFLRRQGLMRDDKPSIDAIAASRDPLVVRAWENVLTVLTRPSLQE